MRKYSVVQMQSPANYGAFWGHTVVAVWLLDFKRVRLFLDFTLHASAAYGHLRMNLTCIQNSFTPVQNTSIAYKLQLVDEHIMILCIFILSWIKFCLNQNTSKSANHLQAKSWTRLSQQQIMQSSQKRLATSNTSWYLHPIIIQNCDFQCLFT